jgi:hypothetical protein
MLFLLGINKFHPVVRILIGAALIAAGLGLGATLLAVPGAVMAAWGGCTWYSRSRSQARREEARLHNSGAAR